MLPYRPPDLRPTGPHNRSDVQAQIATIIAEAKGRTKDQVCPPPPAVGPVMRVAADPDGQAEPRLNLTRIEEAARRQRRCPAP